MDSCENYSAVYCKHGAMNWATWQHVHMPLTKCGNFDEVLFCYTHTHTQWNKENGLWLIHMWAAPVTVIDTQTRDERHHSWLVAVSSFIEIMWISFLGFSEMKICNVCALFVYHPYGDSSIGLRCDMHVACTGKCDCQAQEWIILKSVLWNLIC